MQWLEQVQHASGHVQANFSGLEFAGYMLMQAKDRLTNDRQADRQTDTDGDRQRTDGDRQRQTER